MKSRKYPNDSTIGDRLDVFHLKWTAFVLIESFTTVFTRPKVQ